MIDLYVTDFATSELEEKILQRAKKTSQGDQAVQVHWHSDKLFCEPKYDHAIYVKGFANKGGSGQA